MKLAFSQFTVATTYYILTICTTKCTAGGKLSNKFSMTKLASFSYQTLSFLGPPLLCHCTNIYMKSLLKKNLPKPNTCYSFSSYIFHWSICKIISFFIMNIFFNTELIYVCTCTFGGSFCGLRLRERERELKGDSQMTQ